MEDNNNHYKTQLKKHVATIHSANSLTLLQRKLSNALLFHAYHELNEKDIHEITVAQLCRIIGYSGHNHAAVRSAMSCLVTTLIEWNLVDESNGEEDWTASTILASVRIKGPNCYYSYSHHMKQLLQSPQMYGKINMIVQSKFASNYGLALYENCVRYRNLKQTKWLEIELFRKLMGVSLDTYKVFRDFKRRVLDKAVEEVNCHSDLFIEAEIKRRGRKVVAVRFFITQREKREKLGSEIENSSEDILTNEQSVLIKKLIVTFGLLRLKAVEMLKEYGEVYIDEKIRLVEHSSSYQAGNIDNLAAYITKAVEQNYQVAKSSASNRRQVEFETEKKQKQEEAAENHHKQLREQKRRGKIDKCILALSKVELSLLEEQFCENLKIENTVMFNLYREKGKGSPVVEVLFRNFICEKMLTGEMED